MWVQTPAAVQVKFVEFLRQLPAPVQVQVSLGAPIAEEQLPASNVVFHVPLSRSIATLAIRLKLQLQVVLEEQLQLSVISIGNIPFVLAPDEI